MGIEFFDYTPYVMPLTVLSLFIAVGSLGLLARRRRRVEPLLMGIAGAAVATVGKFAFGIELLLFVGIGLLVGASLMPWRSRVPECCSIGMAQSDDHGGKQIRNLREALTGPTTDS